MDKGNIIIVDYGMGNLHSVYYKIKKIYSDVIISSSKEEILRASKIILPGVGHFATGMKRIREKDIKETLDYKALVERIPVLGICLGMQLFTRRSMEGDVEGLGWIAAETKRFDKEKLNGLKIPHIGWNTVFGINNRNGIFDGIDTNDMFYFIHSYYVVCDNKNDVISSTEHGIRFNSGISCGNIYGLQFHPEKSHDSGFIILKNFVNL